MDAVLCVSLRHLVIHLPFTPTAFYCLLTLLHAFHYCTHNYRGRVINLIHVVCVVSFTLVWYLMVLMPAGENVLFCSHTLNQRDTRHLFELSSQLRK